MFHVPKMALGGAFIGGILMSALGSGADALGGLLILGAIVGAVWNLLNLQRPGLIISLNSGQECFFATRDERGLAAVSDQVYEILERIEEDVAKQFTVNETQVTIRDTTVTGVLNTGAVDGDISSVVGPPGSSSTT